MKRVVFVEQFYYPEGWGGAELPREVTIGLAREGFAVEVICGSDQYVPVEGDSGPDPASFGVRIRRVPRLLSGRVHRLKLLRQLWFYAGLLPRLFFRAPPDVFMAQTNPPLGVVLAALAARVWRRPLVIIAMDVYPDVLFAHGVVGRDSLAGRAARCVFDWSYRTARRIVSLGPVMSDLLRAKNPTSTNIVEISNWATGRLGILRGSANALRTSLNLPSGLTLLYSGNLGIGHEFDTLLQGFAAALQSEPTLSLVIVGRGRRLAEVQSAVTALEIGHAVRFVDFLPESRLPEGMGLADVAVVTLRAGFEGLIVPSKLFGYIARGLPVLYVGPKSDVEHFIRECGCGVSVRNGDAHAVEVAILRLQRDRASAAALGVAGQARYEAQFAREKGVARYIKLVRDVVSTSMEPR